MTIPEQIDAHASPDPIQVVITDFDMPFWSMVGLMVKTSIAAIPAFILLALIGFLVALVFMGGIAAIFHHGP